MKSRIERVRRGDELGRWVLRYRQVRIRMANRECGTFLEQPGTR